jgi:threonine/homoserine/homoserine lactone efflux protein
MIPPDVLLVFFGASLLLALAPGPDNLFVLAQSVQHGAAAGFVLTLGLCTGVVFHTLAVALGLAALVQTSAALFSIIKLLGAAYLLVLAWQALRASGQAATTDRPVPALTHGRLYRRGILMNLTNPKVALFFLAFLPQFVDAARGPLFPQFLLLGVTFILAGLQVFGTLCVVAGRLGARLKRSTSAQRWLHRMTGALFAGLAVKLALSER